MSYLRRLDQARTLLGEGRLLAAEHELREATAAWKSSRLRAPLVEKGIEPALRTLGRVFGRKSDEPILPVFPRRAELLREDLFAFARSLATELLEEIDAVGAGPRRRHDRATEALELQRSSEYFSLLPAREWEVVRAWLTDAATLGCGVRADLLPSGPPPVADRRWWLDWLERWCAAPAEPVRAMADRGRQIAVAYAPAALGAEDEGARWAWVEARLALLDPLAAPHALRAVVRVIELATGPTLREDALVTWAELITNARVLATPGGNARELLESRSMDAARLGLDWPPPSVAARLAERRPAGLEPAFVSVRWQDDATAIAFVLHDGRRATDVLCLKPSAEPDLHDPFAMDDARAQRRIAAWMPPDAILLCAREPGPRLRSLVGSARWIPVEQLLELFGCGTVEATPTTAPAGHPAWNREVCTPWDILIPAARRLLPALEGLFAAWPSLTALWGRENLRRLGAWGLPLADALADAAELVPQGARVDGLVETAPPLGLVWPSLRDRAWPTSGVRPGPAGAEVPHGAGRIWIDRAADAAELARTAVSGGASSLYCVGQARALELADAVARAGDPGRVALVAVTTPCPAPLLELLNRWLSESPGDLERGRAAVWLLALLSEHAGSLDPLLARCGDAALIEEVRARLQECSGHCGSHGDAPCWPVQAHERVEASHVAVVDVVHPAALLPRRRTVADDLRGWVVGVDDAEALRRLRLIPAGPEPVVVFTPGVEFMVTLLGALPGADGGDGEWNFQPSAQARSVAIWAVPRGYGARCTLLVREARSLLEERARRWLADVGEAPLWGEGLEGVGAALEGVASGPASETVLVASLGEPDLESPLLAGLRLAAAASHASARVVCLTPAFAEIFDVEGGLACGEEDPAIPRALDAGSGLLAARRGRLPASWVAPLTSARMESVGASRAPEIAEALVRWTEGRGRVLAGATEADRDAVVEVIARLQSESLDGGPLGVRSAVVFRPDLEGPGATSTAEVRLRALERGRKLTAVLTPSDLEDPAVIDWARRNSSVAWVFRNAETLLDPRLRSAAVNLLAAIRRSQARALFFTDHTGAARAVRDLVVAHLPLEPVFEVVALEPGLEPKEWELRTLGALEVHCPECIRPVMVRSAFELCPDCGIPVDSVASVRRALRVAFEGRVVDALRQLGPQATWSLVVFDAGRRSRLRQRLGLLADAGADAPLLDGLAGQAAADVLLPEDLWRSAAVAGPIIVCGLPDRLDRWAEFAGRLHARGLEPGQWWLAPPGFDDTEALPTAEPEFSIGREEFSRALGAGASGVDGLATLRRLEAAGGSWAGPSRLRVHELVRSAHADDSPLVALGEAVRAGWVGAGALVGLAQRTPTALERAVRAGERLRMPDAPEGATAPRPTGRIAGIGGFGKTSALIALATGFRQAGQRVLTLVPSPVARLEWVERLGDPTVSCLDFDEFLLAFVSAVSTDVDPHRPLRVLPPANRRHGEEVRLELVRTVSQLYAGVQGELPAVDSRSVVRALEGERLGVDPYARDTGVDFSLLERCVDQARQDGGWTDSRELLARARALCATSSTRARAWVEDFDQVLVDDAHDFPVGGLEFLKELFGERVCALGHDPVLSALPDGEVGDRAMQSARFGPAIAEAIEQVWRSTTPLPARVRGRRGLRSVVECERILALSAAVERIADELEADGVSPEVAIVAADERDRRLMEHQLSVRGIGVDGLERDFGELVSGPREVLAALAWVARPPGDQSVDLLRVVLAAGPEPAQSAQAAHYEGRLRRRLQGEEVEVLDRVEAFLLPLVLVRGALGPTTRFEQAVEALLGCGLLERLRHQPAVMGRIATFVRQFQGLSLAELMELIPVERILRPSSGGDQVRLLAPDQLAGRTFDLIYYICTGFEAPERHYRVLSRARRAVKISCSEVDPLQG